MRCLSNQYSIGSARANYRLSTPSFSKLVGYSLAHCSLSQLRNNLEFNTNSDHAKILLNTKKTENHQFFRVFPVSVSVKLRILKWFQFKYKLRKKKRVTSKCRGQKCRATKYRGQNVAHKNVAYVKMSRTKISSVSRCRVQ